MATTSTPQQLGGQAVDFDLEGTDGRRYRLADVAGSRGTVVMFICNHCPYVQAVLPDIVRDMRDLHAHGIGAVAIMPNDTAAYPADSFGNMQRLAAEQRLSFPYVIDVTQDVAHAYAAVCTPDFYGFNADLELQYHGRIYEVRNRQRVPGARRELVDAMTMIAQTGRGPADQHPSIGCSIKWREA
ncbi:MAG TPA: thioredoxin family protein [Alphaproteobacteria bacterium]|nr:thioredoxin family protein [Alphaproteobacteria bacterium]